MRLGDEHHGDHDNLLEQRRIKDRKRYAGMSDAQRAAYNAHRRELYHKQGEDARKRRRERERNRYHSLEGEQKKERNARRAKLERDRYNKLTKEELEARNARRRERAKNKKLATARMATVEVDQFVNSVGLGQESQMHGGLPEVAGAGGGKMDLYQQEQHHDNIADAVSVAAEVAEQAIGAIMDDSTIDAAHVDADGI